MNARGPGRVTATLWEWEMACGRAQLWDADETQKWVLAGPRGRSIMAAEQVAGLGRRGMRDVA